MDAYQKQLQELQEQLAALQKQVAAEKSVDASPATPAVAGNATPVHEPAKTVEEISERQAIQESEIAVHEQTKVETESKYPLKVTGLLLFNGFVNTRQVDVPPDPTYALPGSGSTGLSVRQTVLGLDARGPHIFGAASAADVRVDFFANATGSGYTAGGVLRLRTAHATLDWPNTQAFVELDRPIFSPNAPTSLVATAQPEFAWSGNLWTWNPQAGVSHEIPVSDSKQIKLQAALIDVADPRLPSATANPAPVSLSERSRWPGTEARISFGARKSEAGPVIGVGGYFSPYETADNVRFDAWAATADLWMPLGRHFEMTANAYRGLALGGLGGGGYVDYLYHYNNGVEITVPLDDIGGWTQLKGKVNQRLEFNGGYGIDNPFASEIRDRNAPMGTPPYIGLARNRSAFGNVIYSPSAYLLFSLEYRRLWTNYITGPTVTSDVIGVGAGYRF